MAITREIKLFFQKISGNVFGKLSMESMATKLFV
jgi:hypothetical protein